MFPRITWSIWIAGVAALAGGAGCAGSPPETELLLLPAAPRVPPAGDTLATPTPPGSTRLASFEEVAERLLAIHPDLEAARRRVLAAEAARVQSRAWTNPSLQVDLEGWGLDREGFDESEATLSAVFPLDVVGRRGTRVDRAEAERDVARADYREARRALLARAREAVHAVRSTKERERLASERLRVTEETASVITREVDAGKAPPLEAIRAEVDRERARAELTASRAASRSARLLLGSLLGDAGFEVDVQGQLRGATASADSGAMLAELRLHPAYVASAWRAEAARRRAREVSRSRWPDLSAEIGVRRYLDEDRSAWVTGLGLEIPLWDRNSAAVRGAEELARAAESESESLRRNLGLELGDLTTRLEETERRLELYREDILPRAREALTIARRGFEGGKFGYLELLDAQRALLDVETGHADALIAHDETLERLESLLDREPGDGLVPEVP